MPKSVLSPRQQRVAILLQAMFIALLGLVFIGLAMAQTGRAQAIIGIMGGFDILWALWKLGQLRKLKDTEEPRDKGAQG